MTTLYIDLETRSIIDLRQVGLYNYARHPGTDVWCMAWAFDEEPKLVVPSSPVPDWNRSEVSAHVRDGGIVVAHNAPFELAIWNEIMVPRYGWPQLIPENVRCTMAAAYAMGLPGALEDAALAMGLAMLKDMEGRALTMRMCRPRSVATNGTPVWWDDAAKLARLYAYCQQDVRVMRELHKRLMPLSDKERKVWAMDYEINQRGVAVDVETAKAAVAMTEQVKEQCNVQLGEITGHAVETVTALAALKEWMVGQGMVVGSLAKQAIADLLDTDLPSDVRLALTLRQEAGKASTAKLDRMVDMVDANGRLHNMYQYHGAATGRWAGRGVQTHNLPRDMPKRETVERILELVRAGEYETIDMVYGPPMSVISKCLRSFFLAPPGKVLVSGDFANVESRGGAWFAGEQWKLDAFRQQDAGTGPDVYKLGASRLLGIPVDDVTPEQRQSHGKVPDLAFQYQGGVGSGKTMGKTYGVKATDKEWDERKLAWRAAHPRIVQTWYDIQNAAIRAVRRPGEDHACGSPGRQAKFKMAGSFLWCLLPSGRVICYPYPKILEGEYGPQLTYMTVPDPSKPEKIIYDPRNANNWARVGTYGGALFNRIVQGFSRDILSDCMLGLHEYGAKIVIHTHDDVNLEVAAVNGDLARAAMQDRMQTPPEWAKGFPLFAKVDTMVRYGK